MCPPQLPCCMESRGISPWTDQSSSHYVCFLWLICSSTFQMFNITVMQMIYRFIYPSIPITSPSMTANPNLKPNPNPNPV